MTRPWCGIVLAGALLGCSGSGAKAELGDVTGDGGDTSTGSPVGPSSGAMADSTSGAASTTSTASSDGGTVSPGDTTGGPLICGRVGSGPLEIGHGVKAFTTLAEAPAQLFHGPQGGVHITLGIRCPGLDVSQFADVQMRGTIDGTVVADHPQGAVLMCDDELGVAEGIWLNMIFEVGPEAVHDQIIDLDLTVTDDVGRQVSAQAQTLILDPRLMGGSSSDSGSSGTGPTGSGGSTG